MRGVGGGLDGACGSGWAGTPAASRVAAGAKGMPIVCACVRGCRLGGQSRSRGGLAAAARARRHASFKTVARSRFGRQFANRASCPTPRSPAQRARSVRSAGFRGGKGRRTPRNGEEGLPLSRAARRAGEARARRRGNGVRPSESTPAHPRHHLVTQADEPNSPTDAGTGGRGGGARRGERRFSTQTHIARAKNARASVGRHADALSSSKTHVRGGVRRHGEQGEQGESEASHCE